MPRGWDVPMTDKGPSHFEFECENCGTVKVAASKAPHITKTKRGITESYRVATCPTCKADLRTDEDPNKAAGCSPFPTKALKKAGQTYYVHDRKPETLPAGFAEQIALQNALFAANIAQEEE